MSWATDTDPGDWRASGEPTAARSLQVLIVDDSHDDTDLIVAALEDAGIAVLFERVAGEQEMAAALDRGAWEIVLCDHSMPGFSSRQALALMAQKGSMVPVIVVSGAIGEEETVAVMRAGAVDFVSKDRLSQLPAAVERARTQAAREAERERLERELEQARRHESIGRLASGIAQELENMLAVILAYNEAISTQLGDDHPLHDKLLDVRAAAEHSAALATDLLTFGRQRMLARDPIAAAELPAAVAELLRSALDDRVELVIEDESDQAMILGDRRQLEHALINLALNAGDAMPHGGRLTIRTARRAALGPGANGSVVVTVTDTGLGMSNDVRDRAFEPFFTTKDVGRGTGLGLAVVQGIVEQTGGQVSVESRLGHGTTFTIELPELAPPAARELVVRR